VTENRKRKGFSKSPLTLSIIGLCEREVVVAAKGYFVLAVIL